MKRIVNSTMKRTTVRGIFRAACIISLAMQPLTASPAFAATTVPVLWTAGGVSISIDNAGQAAGMATDAFGNVAVVSGPAGGSDLAVTSYTQAGALRWQSVVSPTSGTFVGVWVVAAPDGDFVAVGHNVNSNGRAIGSTLVRYAPDGTLRWRVDLVTIVSRLLVDTGGNAYMTIRGFDIQLLKYSPSGVLLWQTGNSTGSYIGAQSLALSQDETDVVLAGYVIGGATWVTASFNAATGAPNWLATAAEGTGASDVVMDATRVYVTGTGSIGTNRFLTVVAYDRASGARLWRTDANPPAVCCAYGHRIALAPDGSLAVVGQTYSGGYYDWWIVAMDNNGFVRWQARRDRAVTGDEVPAAVFVLADGTTVVSGSGGPAISDTLGTYMQGVTAGYSPSGTLLWEGFSRRGAVWATALPNGDVCATGGYDALITCFTIIVNPSSTVLRSTAIDLSATLQGKKVSVSGNVTVRDSSGAAVSGAVVSATWTNPGGATAAQTVTTDSTGIARFSTTGGRGTYTLTVGNIAKTGYTFDAANSVLTKSITK